eukprot:6194088-Pleurochrysis_carterae.AAC.2
MYAKYGGTCSKARRGRSMKCAVPQPQYSGEMGSRGVMCVNQTPSKRSLGFKSRVNPVMGCYHRFHTLCAEMKRRHLACTYPGFTRM